MKIYNRVVVNMSTGEIIESDSFEYDGEIAQCWTGAATIVGALITSSSSGGSTYYPGPSPEEQELMELQLEALKSKKEDWEKMEPWMLAAMGLIEEGGELRKMTEEEYLGQMSEIEKGQYELLQLAQERQRKAYAGELDISPALEKSLAGQEEQMGEMLSQKLGPDWATTTAGQQSMSSFKERADLVREEARRGEIQGGGATTMAYLQQLSGLHGEKGGRYAQFAGRAGGLFAGYGAAMAPYQQQRQAAYQGGLYQQGLQSQQQTGLYSGLGSLIGSGIQAYGAYKGAGY